MKKKIPNILTVTRTIFIPFFLYFIFGYENTKIGSVIALFLFVIASITDWLDGYLARKYKVISNFGKIMDPLADKLLVMSALFALAMNPIKMISIVPVLIILFREVSVTILRKHYSSKNVFIPANIWGKLKTIFQMVGIIGTLLFYSIINLWNIPEGIILNVNFGIRIFFWIIAVITVLSGLSYFKPLLKKEKK